MYEKGNITRLILFTALFALLFINIFQPYNSRDWYPGISEFKYFFFSSLIILTGMLVVVVSRLIMLAFTKKNSLLVWQYACWILVEILAMSLFTPFLPVFFLVWEPNEI
jgi:membrane-associated phospholipid phosphatase